ncbi:hypothetical protein [Nocardioides sp. W7]|uniref:hypothetical protein n=1 Tax=Nocardioides sp. W7 TaxID=2931390 RepID=UPI001FD1D64D|nr:hypothetical protein [Nocardioides sp. W7]
MTAGRRLLVPAVLAVLLLAGCGGSGIGAVTENDGFSTCVEDAGASTEGGSDWDIDEQLRFWVEPGVLACAADQLGDDELEEALADAFVDPDDVDDTVAVAQAQQAAVRQLAADVAAADGEDEAVSAAGRVLSAAPSGDDRTLGRVAALGIVEGTDGLPGYQEFLTTNDLEDGSDALTRYDDQVEAEGPDELRDRLRELSTRVGDAT